MPVQVLDDDDTERRELLTVRLLGASGDVLPGSPGTTVVAIAPNRR